ncbi:MAG: hypothetical protein R2710_26790 [Acidimicrobiales bacterium]
MGERTHRLAFPLERTSLCGGLHVDRQDLQCHVTTEVALRRPKDATEPAGSDALDDVEAWYCEVHVGYFDPHRVALEFLKPVATTSDEQVWAYRRGIGGVAECCSSSRSC